MIYLIISRNILRDPNSDFIRRHQSSNTKLLVMGTRKIVKGLRTRYTCLQKHTMLAPCLKYKNRKIEEVSLTIDSRKMNRTSYLTISFSTHERSQFSLEYLRTHWASVKGCSATTAVIGLFLSVFCALLIPVALSIHHRLVRISIHAILSPSVSGARCPGTTASISASV